jgi:D-alanyl-D-alanine carboxypeptidase
MLVITLVFCLAPATASSRTTDRQVFDATVKVLSSKLAPPGVIVTMRRGGRTTAIRVGKRQLGVGGEPKLTDHMRIASITKAYTGAVVLRLIDQGRIALDDTVGQHLPSLPAAWHGVTIRQLLDHTSGIPDYTKSKGFINQFQTAPRARVSPSKIIDWVRTDPLLFPPSSKYEYSNTDNIIAALIAEAVAGRTYPNLLKRIIFEPLKLKGTSLPATAKLKKPFIHGYTAEPGKWMGLTLTEYTDVSTILSPTGAWASGGIESTPKDLGKFIRELLARRFFSAKTQKEQFKWVKGGQSSPAGPGKNSAGLSLFRYQTRCGTVYGHTGNFPGYTQFAAADRTGRRSVTTTLNIPAPTGKLLARVRNMQTKAVCRVLGK